LTVYLDMSDLLASATALLGHPPQVRDLGLLDSALARPAASMYGVEAYPDLHQKAAALLVSVINNHALVDGNKRLGWVATRLFYGLNRKTLAMPGDPAYDLVMEIASGELDDVQKTAARLSEYVIDVPMDALA
jgi:death-on-curing protein